jgi:hypothetical protein
MLNTVVSILHLACHYKVSVCLPLYDVGWYFIFSVASVQKVHEALQALLIHLKHCCPADFLGTIFKLQQYSGSSNYLVSLKRSGAHHQVYRNKINRKKNGL